MSATATHGRQPGLPALFSAGAADWKRLAYIGTEIRLLSHFLKDAHEGAPRIDNDKADRWREIIRGEA